MLYQTKGGKAANKGLEARTINRNKEALLNKVLASGLFVSTKIELFVNLSNRQL
jgi:hypothetical protein